MVFIKEVGESSAECIAKVAINYEALGAQLFAMQTQLNTFIVMTA